MKRIYPYYKNQDLSKYIKENVEFKEIDVEIVIK